MFVQPQYYTLSVFSWVTPEIIGRLMYNNTKEVLKDTMSIVHTVWLKAVFTSTNCLIYRHHYTWQYYICAIFWVT